MGMRTKWLGAALLAAGMVGAAQAQTVKVGIIAPFSGPFAHYGTLFKAGAEAYVASQGGKLAGQNIEFVWRDEGGPNPANTRTLAQELVVKDKVDYIGGIVFSPNASAVADLLAARGVTPVTFRDWRKIDAAEVGAALEGNPREKFVSIDAMLDAAGLTDAKIVASNS